MNGWGRWRLEFTLHNRHHTPAFESQRVKISVPQAPVLFHTNILSVCRLIQLFHSISTLPISLHKYNVSLDMVEIGTMALK